MRIADFVKAVMADPAKFLPETKDYSTPKGWFTVEQIRHELNLAYTRNASSRAFDLHRRGVLDRQAHQFKANTGQCHRAYVYRPRPPFKTIRQASEGVAQSLSDKVPAGWVRIIDYSYGARISHVAIRARVERSNLEPRYFKTPRGVSGLHRNAYYRKADLDRLVSKAP